MPEFKEYAEIIRRKAFDRYLRTKRSDWCGTYRGVSLLQKASVADYTFTHELVKHVWNEYIAQEFDKYWEAVVIRIPLSNILRNMDLSFKRKRLKKATILDDFIHSPEKRDQSLETEWITSILNDIERLNLFIDVPTAFLKEQVKSFIEAQINMSSLNGLEK